MTTKNSVYTVTPPDLTLNTLGPCILLLGISLDDAVKYADIYDKLLPEVEITVYVSEHGYTDKLAPWFRAVTGMASTIFVNVDNITTEEMFLAMQAEHHGDAIVYWVSLHPAQHTLVSLLNSYQHQIFHSLESIEQFLEHEYGNST